jgi:hypothetical protein
MFYSCMLFFSVVVTMRFDKDTYIATLCVGSLLTTYNFSKQRKQETCLPKRPAMMHIMKDTVVVSNICHPILLDFCFAAMLAFRYTQWFGRISFVI